MFVNRLLARKGVPSQQRWLSTAAAPLTSTSTNLSSKDQTAQLFHRHTQTSTLSNGVRVVTETVPNESDTATVGVFIDAGSCYENEKNNGVAHFAEHMFFKGTERRPYGSIEAEVEQFGGHLNAYTSREQTVFTAQSSSDQAEVNQCLDLLSDMLLHSKFDVRHIENERGVILREMEHVESNVEEVLFDKLHETAFRGHPLGRTILGPPENIRTISRDDIVDYHRRHYTADRMVVSVAGSKVDHAKVVAEAEKLFSSVPQKALDAEGKEVKVELAPTSFLGSDIRLRQDGLDQAHVAYGFPTAGWADRDHLPLMLIQSLIGGWDSSLVGGEHSSSPLVAQLASTGGVSRVNAFNTVYTDTGLFGINLVADGVGMREDMEHVAETLTGFSYSVDSFALQEAKLRTKMGILQQLDSSSSVCDEIGRQMLVFGRRVPILEYLARIDAVTYEEVQRAAHRFFYDRDFALSAIGPVHELPDYSHIRRRTYFLRY